MKSSPKLRPNGWDALAAAAVLALAVACTALFWTGGEEIGPLTAVVSANGEPVDRVVLADLSGPEERTYTSNGYTLRVAFGPESAQVTVSDCPGDRASCACPPGSSCSWRAARRRMTAWIW